MSRARTRYLLTKMDEQRKVKLAAMSEEEHQQFLAEENKQMAAASEKARRYRQRRAVELKAMSAGKNDMVATAVLVVGTIIAIAIFK